MQSMNNSFSSELVIPSPYYIDHSDEQIALPLVSNPLTGEKNYMFWSRSMQIALSARNKLGFIDGTLPQPTDESLAAWTCNNALVALWILNSISKEISASLVFVDSAREMWIHLKQRYSYRNRLQYFLLRRELTNLAQNQQTVSAYFAKLKKISEELNSYGKNCCCGKCSCGGVEAIVEYQEVELLMSFVMGLNDSFSQISSRIVSMNPPPSLNNAFSLVIQEEELRKIDDRAQKKDHPVCSHCKIRGHVVDQCFKLHGYPGRN